jgi:hypothetical protein
MAKFGFPGAVGGSVGPVIIYQSYGKSVMRSKPGARSKPPGDVQKKNNNHFASVMKVMQVVRDFVKIGFFDVAQGRSPFHEAMSENLMRIRSAPLSLDLEWLQISKGQRAGCSGVSVEREGNTALVKWEHAEADKPSLPGDRVMLLAINTSTLDTKKSTDGKRKDHQARIDLPPIGDGQRVLVLISFRHPDEIVKKDARNMSDSMVAGSIV